jgi:hypothetical protein
MEGNINVCQAAFSGWAFMNTVMNSVFVISQKLVV